eukprot:TRINITY_DN632_c0_g1_i1.p1 TRINITY_DN632_c0_g1~~TRINITY_DN632_c0_g1_i1.p1  ORF type:complete len:225 (+),score=55.15 TRINITY_DN632_c0_g1_i1:98-676(+)
MTAPGQTDLNKLGHREWGTISKINAELLTLTYGALVTQLLKEMDTVEDVNVQLEKMGYNIGVRLIEEFLARSQLGRCANFKETAEVIAKVGFKMFLGRPASVIDVNTTEQSFSLVLEENPLIEFVEVPEQFRDRLVYSVLICGVLRGALEMVQMRVQCSVLKDPTKGTGDGVTEISVKLIEILTSEIPVGDG